MHRCCHAPVPRACIPLQLDGLGLQAQLRHEQAQHDSQRGVVLQLGAAWRQRLQGRRGEAGRAEALGCTACSTRVSAHRPRNAVCERAGDCLPPAGWLPCSQAHLRVRQHELCFPDVLFLQQARGPVMHQVRAVLQVWRHGGSAGMFPCHYITHAFADNWEHDGAGSLAQTGLAIHLACCSKARLALCMASVPRTAASSSRSAAAVSGPNTLSTTVQ